MTGVYCIRNLITGAFYIGSAARDVYKRWQQHRAALRSKRHHNFHLQAAWRFYGESSFRFTVVEECPPEKCIEREQWFIDIFDPVYNICRVAGAPMMGRHPSAETRLKLHVARLGNKNCVGHHPSLEARAKMRVASTGNKYALGSRRTAAMRTKLSMAKCGNKNPFFGHHHSPAALIKMSEAAKGHKRHLGHRHSAGTCAKISTANTGKVRTSEMRIRYSLAKKAQPMTPALLAQLYALHAKRRGQKFSDETRTRMRAAQAQRRAREAVVVPFSVV